MRKFFTEREFTELYLAWCNDSHQRVKSTQNFQTFKQILSKCNDKKLVFRSSRIGKNTAIAISGLFIDRPKIRKIDLHENVIRDKGCSALVELLNHKNNGVTHLNIGSNDIGRNGILPLCEYLKSPNCRVRVLILGSEDNELYTNKIDHVAGVELAKSLYNNKTLEILELNRNVFLGKKNQKAFKEFAKTFKHNKNLTTLTFGCTNLSTNSCVNLLNSLSSNLNLHYLDLHGNSLGSIVSSSLSKILIKDECKLSVLLLHRNNLGLRGTKILCESLKKNKSVCVLNISSNKIGEEYQTGLSNKRKIGVQLNQNSSKFNDLEILNSIGEKNDLNQSKTIDETTIQIPINPLPHAIDGFSSNDVLHIDLGAQEIASLIKVNKTITYLNLKNNGIHIAGCVNIANALKVNRTISHLILSNNKFYDEGIKELGKAIKNHESLKKLDIGSTCIGDKGAVPFFISFSSNTSLIKLHIHNNHLSEDSGIVLSEILERNYNLLTVEIHGNQIEHSTMLKIKKLLKRNKHRKSSQEPIELEKELVRLKYADHLLNRATELYKIKRGEKEKIVSDLMILEDQIRNINENHLNLCEEKKNRILSEEKQIQKINDDVEEKKYSIDRNKKQFERKGRLNKISLNRLQREKIAKDQNLNALIKELESLTINKDDKRKEYEEKMKSVIEENQMTKKAIERMKKESEEIQNSIDDLMLAFGNKKYVLMSIFEKRMEVVEKARQQKLLDLENEKLQRENEKLEKEREKEQILKDEDQEEKQLLNEIKREKEEIRLRKEAKKKLIKEEKEKKDESFQNEVKKELKEIMETNEPLDKVDSFNLDKVDSFNEKKSEKIIV